MQPHSTTRLTNCQAADCQQRGRKLAVLPTTDHRQSTSYSWLLHEPLNIGALLSCFPSSLARSGAKSQSADIASKRVHAVTLLAHLLVSTLSAALVLVFLSSRLQHNSSTSSGLILAPIIWPTSLRARQFPHYTAHGSRNAGTCAFYIFFRQKPTYLQEVAFPQLC